MALIEVQHLKKYFDVPNGTLHAVDDVSFKIEKGTTMGVVGESGCGKSTLGTTLIHLQESTGGKILFEGRDVTHLDKKELRTYREDVQIIFQDPYSSLNPRYNIARTIMEPLEISGRFKSKEEIRREADRIMDLVGIEERLRGSYPHELAGRYPRTLSGGQRQRVGIARALAMNPKFIVCDEPVSALDVSIQAQVLNLLMDLQEQKQLTYMFVTHDLSVVRHISDNICVMYLGQLVETCSSKKLFEKPLHPYTQALLSAIPSTDVDRKMQRVQLKGELTSPINPKPGCRFAARCPYATAKCQEPQQLREIESGHFVQCCRIEEID